MFERTEDERRRGMVQLSAKNQRLNDCKDDDSGPDSGHYSIHRAIFSMIELAPTTMGWLYSILELLSSLLPEQTQSPASIDAALSRWANLKEDSRGFYTSLSAVQEVRCLIAALYGSGFVNNKTVVFGDSRHSDIARRCAFYANESLNVKQLNKFAEADGDAFIFAASYNSGLLRNRDARSALKNLAFGEMATFLARRIAQCREARPAWFQD